MPQSDYPILRVEISRASKSFKHPLLTKKRANLTQECSNHHISLSTLRSKGLSCRKMKWSAIYTNLTVNAIVRQSHPWSADSQGQERFSALPADEKTLNYNTKVLKPPSLPIKPKVKGIELYQDDMVSHIYKVTSECDSQTTPSSERR